MGCFWLFSTQPSLRIFFPSPSVSSLLPFWILCLASQVSPTPWHNFLWERGRGLLTTKVWTHILKCDIKKYTEAMFCIKLFLHLVVLLFLWGYRYKIHEDFYKFKIKRYVNQVLDSHYLGPSVQFEFLFSLIGKLCFRPQEHWPSLSFSSNHLIPLSLFFFYSIIHLIVLIKSLILSSVERMNDLVVAFKLLTRFLVVVCLFVCF